VEALVRRLHDLRVGVGEVALRLRLRLRRLLVVALAALTLRLQLRLGLQRRLRLPDPLQAPLAAGKLLGQLVAAALSPVAGIVGLVCLLGLLEQRLCLRPQLGQLGLEPALLPAHPLVAHRLVPGGVRPQLRPVQSDSAQLDQPRLGADGERLREQLGERLQVAAAEAGDRTVVGVLIDAEEAHRDIVVGALLQLARGGSAGRIAVQQKLQHQARVVGREAPLLLVGGVDRREVEPVLDEVGDEAGEMAVGDPVLDRRGKQQQLIGVVGTERLVDTNPLSLATLARRPLLDLAQALLRLRCLHRCDPHRFPLDSLARERLGPPPDGPGY